MAPTLVVPPLFGDIDVDVDDDNDPYTCVDGDVPSSWKTAYTPLSAAPTQCLLSRVTPSVLGFTQFPTAYYLSTYPRCATTCGRERMARAGCISPDIRVRSRARQASRRLVVTVIISMLPSSSTVSVPGVTAVLNHNQICVCVRDRVRCRQPARKIDKQASAKRDFHRPRHS